MTKFLLEMNEKLRQGINEEIQSDANKLEMAEWLLYDVNKTFTEAFQMSLGKGKLHGTENTAGAIAIKLAHSICEIKMIKEALRKMII